MAKPIRPNANTRLREATIAESAAEEHQCAQRQEVAVYDPLKSCYAEAQIAAHCRDCY